MQGKAERVCAQLQPKLQEITTQFERKTWQSREVIYCARLPDLQVSEGRMQWGEEWVYPSEDLVRYVFGAFPYDCASRQRVARDDWRITLAVCLEAGGSRLLVHIPLTPLPWLEPRGLLRYLKRSAQHAGYSWKGKDTLRFMQQFQEPHPQLDQCEWRLQVSDQTSCEEVLTSLVSGALRHNFFASSEDQQAALTWVRCIVQRAVRRVFRGSDNSQQLMDDLSNELPDTIFQHLLDHFDLPATSDALQLFIHKAASGYARNALRKHARTSQPPTLIDPRSGNTVYLPHHAAQECGVDVSTIYRWMKVHGCVEVQGRRGLSEAQLAALQRERLQAEKRKAIMNYLTQEMGKSSDAAKKWIQRHVARGDSFEDMTQVLLARRQ
jgi:hypothetical protein